MSKNKYYLSLSVCVALAGLAFACSDDSKNVESTLSCADGLTICGHACCADTCCDGVCVNTKNDKNNCGTCGNACLDGKVCMNNDCISNEEACQEGQEWCSGECVSIESDARHCGDCETHCDTGESCQGGKCVAGCAEGYSFVGDGKCVNIQRDSENCGQAGNVCGDNAYCADGSCACRNGYFDCDNDMANGCESDVVCDFACESGQQLCQDTGTCCDAGTSCCGSSCCAEGTTCCGGESCLDLSSDPHHCGDCNIACNSNQVCESGGCIDADTNCPEEEGIIACWGNCVQSLQDKDNCGECGHACDEGLVCTDGKCTIACADDETVCGDVCAKLNEDPLNCGACGTQCATTQVCTAIEEGYGCKEITEVNPEFVCENTTDPEAGTEITMTQCWSECVDLQTASDHCGKCGISCDDGSECVAGVCTKTCESGLNACGESCHDFQNDVLACGNCETQCATTQTCVEGVCTDTELNCNEGTDPEDPAFVEKTLCWGNCTDLKTDTANCGACGKMCEESQVCTDGVCIDNGPVVVDCDEASKCYGVCKDFQNDDANCGKCMNACGKGEKCIEGKCELQCGSLTACGSACVDTNSSDTNCGACGVACKDGQACVGGACQCAEGRYNCDGNAANGCEATEKCVCEPGKTQGCWRGLAENRGKGICKDGTQTCDASGQFWGPCKDGVYPSAITCDEKGIPYNSDQNCNGIADSQDECVTACDLKLSDSSYIGCEYWAAYTQNHATQGEFSVILSNMNDEEAKITIYKGSNSNPVKSVTIPKGAVQAIGLENNGTGMLTGTTVQSSGFRIVSTQPVTAYMFNPLRSSAVWNDALLLLPKNVYGTSYYNIIGVSSTDFSYNDTYIAIQATSPGKTTIKVTPSVKTLSGSNVAAGGSIASINAKTEYSITLNQYEVFQLESRETAGMSGTSVTGDKPFIAIGGCSSCYNAVRMSGDVRDHYSEQLFPYQSWGKNYAFAGFKKQGSENDQCQILSQKNAVLTITPAIKDANKGTIGGANKVNITANVPYTIVTKEPFYLSSTEPILVAGYLGDEGTPKDPSYSLMVPVEQFRKDYSFMIPANYNENNITIIAPSNISDVKLYEITSSGNTLINTFNNSMFTKIGTTGWAYYHLDIGTASKVYKLTADKPVGLQSYGYVGSSSYAYPLGLNLTKLNNTN